MNNKNCSVALILIPLLFAAPALAKKTIGEVLKNIEGQKNTTALPQISSPAAPDTAHENIQDVQPPPRSTLYYDEGSDEGQLERTTNEGINQLYKLTQQFRTSKHRGELWLRLAELYVEKARLIEYHIQLKYDQQVRAAQAHKNKSLPKINLKPAQDYNKKAIQLYEWFVRDFPKDPKMDQALFFLGYNYFELGDTTKGKKYYERLSTEYSTSPYVDESNFALGEYYFDRLKWQNALEYYQRVIQNHHGRLYSFALYKSAWCQYKTGQTTKALGSLELVIRAGRSTKSEDSGNMSRIRLASEAMRDLVLFYGEAGDYKEAQSYFEKVAGEKNAFNLTEKLAYFYADTGNKTAAQYVFKELIDAKPNSPKAFDYEYQVILLVNASGNKAAYQEELSNWIQTYGLNSQWAKSNINNKEIVAKSQQLIESTLRNHILQLHQTAQNSHSAQAQKYARSGYQLYFDNFSESKRVDEMHFFYGELLFDMKEFDDAAVQYLWVSENAPKSKYYEKSVLNSILALEKRLPKADEIKKIVGDSTEAVEFTDTMKAFEKASLRYFKTAKKVSDTVAVKYRLASLYYYFNQFDHAIPLFKEIIHDAPKSQYAEYSANLLLDTYNLKKDYAGLEQAAQDLLKTPEMQNSKIGDQIRSILQRTSFKKAQDLEKNSDFAKSAATYEEFARKNPRSDLGVSAFYNAGLNYEKAGDLNKASQMYAAVVAIKTAPPDLRKNSSKFSAALYEKTGQYAKAAESFERYASENPKDKEAVNFYYNAAIIRDGLNDYSVASRNYQKYFDLSRKLDRAEVLFLMAKLAERQKKSAQAISYYKQYLDSGAKNASQVVEAAFSIASLDEKLNRHKETDEYFAKTIAIQKRVGPKNDNAGASFAAEARFKQVYKAYEELRAIRIPAGPRQAQAVQDKLAKLNRLKEEIKSVILYDDGYQIVAGLTTMGQAYQHMAASLYNAAVPKGLDDNGLKEYRAGIDKIAKPFAEEAEKSYLAAIERGQKLESYNDYMKVAFRELSALQPEKYHDYQERAIFTKVPDPLIPQDDAAKSLAEAASRKNETEILQNVGKILGHDQINLYALTTLGLFYFNQGKYGLAKIIFNRALKDHETEPSLHNNVGVIFLAEGNQRKALTSFKKALEVQNEYRIAGMNLASIYLEYHDYSRALTPLESGYNVVKSDLKKENKEAIGVANNYALALSGTGDNQKAKEIYKQLVDLNLRNPTVLLNYAILLIEKLKDKSEGKSVVNKLKFAAMDGSLDHQVNRLEEKLKGLQQ